MCCGLGMSVVCKHNVHDDEPDDATTLWCNTASDKVLRSNLVMIKDELPFKFLRNREVDGKLATRSSGDKEFLLEGLALVVYGTYECVGEITFKKCQGGVTLSFLILIQWH